MPLVQGPKILSDKTDITCTSADSPFHFGRSAPVGDEEIVVVRPIAEIKHALPIAQISFVSPTAESHVPVDPKGSNPGIGKIAAVKIQSLAELTAPAVDPARPAENLSRGGEAGGIMHAS